MVRSNFLLRFLSSIILLPLVLLSIKIGNVVFDSILIMLTFFIAVEWIYITKSYEKHALILGMLYCVIPMSSMKVLRDLPDGLHLTYFLLFIVVASDIGGYIFGKTIKGWKLLPIISPNKTWAGFAGGLILSLAVGYFMKSNLLAAFIISISSQIGDLLESFIKRKYNVKDSGEIIPGHGGVLDRVDGLLVAAPITLLLHLIGVL